MGFLNAFSVIGRFFLLGSAVCVVAGLVLSGGAGVALLVVALSIGITGLVFTFIGAKLGKVSRLDKALRATGVPGTAEITSLRETGVIVNGSPVLELGLRVDSSAHARFETTIRQRVPRLLVGAFLPGATVAIRIDPADQDHLAIDWESAAPTPPASARPSVPVYDQFSSGSPHLDAEQLLLTGRPAKAVVISMRDAGDMSELGLVEVGAEGDDDRLFIIDMEVQQAGLDFYEVRVAHRVPEQLVGRVGPRTRLRVAIDRDDDHAVAIDWDSV